MKNFYTLFYTLTVIITSVFLTACDSSPKYVYLEGETMGTTYHIRYQIPKNVQEVDIRARISARLNAVNDSMSTYQEHSLISQINNSPAQTHFKPDADFANVFASAKQVYAESNGAFDPTVMPLVELWGFGKTMTVERLNNPPTKQQINDALSRVGFHQFSIDASGQLLKTSDKAGLDFSAIAKGYGVDVIADVLKDFAINNYMVEIGGEVSTKGVNDQLKPWQIAIDAPIINQSIYERQTIALIRQPQGEMLNLATSGNYRNSVVFDGQRYSHTIDPTTGYPISGGAPSVTVASSSVMLADAWATALTAMPYDRAWQMAVDKNLAVLFVVPRDETGEHKDISDLEGWQVIQTPAMKQLREKNRA